MTILTMDRKALEEKIGKITPEIGEDITAMGTPIEDITSEEVSVEIFPNRPDLLNLQNIALAINQYRGKKGIHKYTIKEPEKNYTVTINKNVKKVRPYTVCMIAKKLHLNNENIKELIDLQEKLHNSIGRKRKKVAIGIYPLEKITLPITFQAEKPEDITFQPLETNKELTGKEILEQHPTGKTYKHLLEEQETYPIFKDAKGKILSMPPIINSQETGTVTTNTKELFIECSGNNKHYLEKSLNIIALTLQEMGATLHKMNIKDQKEGNNTTPNTTTQTMPFNIGDINNTLGLKLTEKETKKLLANMGIEQTQTKKGLEAHIPAYRTDILHWIDLTEEIAIAYGYKNITPELPAIATIAEEQESTNKKNLIQEILIGLGLQEINTYHLTTKNNIKKMHYEQKEFIELTESKNERDTLRGDLHTNTLQVLSENSDAAYPQKLFEIGTIFKEDDNTETGIKEEEHLIITLAEENTRITELQQILHYLMKNLGTTYTIEPTENNNYIPGRAANIKIGEETIGTIGELAPRILKNWKIKVPVTTIEITTKKL